MIIKTHEEQYTIESDPRRSIFLPKTEYPEREFGAWEAAISMRRGVLFPDVVSSTETFEYQQKLHEELCMVRDWHMGNLATNLANT